MVDPVEIFASNVARELSNKVGFRGFMPGDMHDAVLQAFKCMDWKELKRPFELSGLGKNVPAVTSAPDILDKAGSHLRDRAGTYDSPEGERSMGKVVAMFNACHGDLITEEQGWHLLELVKHVRYFSAPEYHADSIEDGAAYAALRGEAGMRREDAAAQKVDEF